MHWEARLSRLNPFFLDPPRTLFFHLFAGLSSVALRSALSHEKLWESLH